VERAAVVVARVDVPQEIRRRRWRAPGVDLEEDVAELRSHEHANGLLRYQNNAGNGSRSQRRHDCASEPYPTYRTYPTYQAYLTYPTDRAHLTYPTDQTHPTHPTYQPHLTYPTSQNR
jgi:hypothetical protein